MKPKPENPYKSPTDTECQSNFKKPHGTSVLKEAWRGAKFGAKIMAIVLGIVVALVWVFFLGLFIFRWLSTGLFTLEPLGGVLGILKQIALTIFVVTLSSLYGGIAGAFVMGIAAFVRKFRGSADENT